jgi:beta-barrel assembly-enhancing protease
MIVRGTTMRRRILGVLLLTLATLPNCAARKPGDPLKPGFNLFSKEQDVQLGKEAAQQIRQQVDVVDNPQLQAYIQRIGQRLSQSPLAGGYPYTFTLVNDKTINAFALPGGPTFIHTGLIAAADNEAQLAGVIGHEIAHVALRHGTNQASKANLIQLPAMLAGAAAGSGVLGSLAQLGIGLGANSVLLKYSRDAEQQADALGARLMAQAGYNPIEAARFFEKLEAEGGARGPQWFSSHPNPGNRMRDIQAEIRILPQQNYNFNTGDFARAKSLVGGLPAPRTPRASNADRQIPSSAPAGGMRQVRTQTFALSYPENWRAFGGEDSSSVTIAPQDGLVQGSGGNTQIGYGVIASYFFPESRQRNLRASTDALIDHLHGANASMRLASDNRRRVRVGGSEGMITMLESNSPFGGVETDALLTVNRPEGLFYMVFIAPQSEFGQLQPTFDRMVQSIQFAGS